MPVPNLFALATSELTQDAMLAWLLAWAAPFNAEVDAVLHATGRRLVDALFATHGEAPDADATIDIRRQELNVSPDVGQRGDGHRRPLARARTPVAQGQVSAMLASTRGRPRSRLRRSARPRQLAGGGEAGSGAGFGTGGDRGRLTP